MSIRPDQGSVARPVKPRFCILGPLQVLDNDLQIHPGSRKQQLVLAALLCRANTPVPVEALVEALWPDEPPRTARKNIQVYLSVLRGLLRLGAGPGARISYQAGGYILHATAAELDSLRFEQQAQAGHRLRQSGQPAAVAQTLAGALELWRGRALDGMRDIPLINTAAQRLERLYLSVFEDWAEAEIATGGGAGAIERITEIAAEHPLRERLRILQMTALCQAGRRAEALAVYDELRQALAHELGLSPGLAVVSFYQSLLREEEPPGRTAAGSPDRPAVPPSLLPWDLPVFAGRAEQTRQLTDALVNGSNRLVVVTGLLGAGKTALAVHVAHNLSDSFPDGRFFIRLRDDEGALRPLDEVVSQLMWAVTPAVTPDPLPTGPRAWQLWLARHRALVVLDDARKEQDVRPLLPEGGDSAVMVTARSRLAGLDAAYRVRVPPFALAEGAEFLTGIIGAERVAAERAAAERIVAASGSLPLALRLVAERLSLLHHVSLSDYATRLTDPSELLDEVTAGDVAIRARLGEAIAELPEPARQAVVRLGTLPAPMFTAAEAAVVLDAGEVAVVRLLESLLAASVITVSGTSAGVGGAVYELPALAYAFAREVAATWPDLTEPVRLAPRGLA